MTGWRSLGSQSHLLKQETMRSWHAVMWVRWFGGQWFGANSFILVLLSVCSRIYRFRKDTFPCTTGYLASILTQSCQALPSSSWSLSNSGISSRLPTTADHCQRSRHIIQSRWYPWLRADDATTIIHVQSHTVRVWRTCVVELEW